MAMLADPRAGRRIPLRWHVATPRELRSRNYQRNDYAVGRDEARPATLMFWASGLLKLSLRSFSDKI